MSDTPLEEHRAWTIGLPVVANGVLGHGPIKNLNVIEMLTSLIRTLVLPLAIHYLQLVDAAGKPIHQYFRSHVDIVDKNELSPLAIADRAAEKAMCSIFSEHFSTHAIYGEENE
ncbi:hypothetical protein SUGI_0500450 [Cryptomeria japonica]|nr:hypothetical protein SUGI_0500450 [Cryptomeria japonica]